MARETPETHRLQPDPPEGDREKIDRELKRQDEKAGKAGQPADQRSGRGDGACGG